MFAFIVRRLLLMFPTTIGVALVVFLLYHAAPGDPATVMMGTGGEMTQGADSESRKETFRRENGLDRNLVVQFLDYIGPLNLSRDGHPWFSSPYNERAPKEVELTSGEVILEGRAVPIAYRPGASEEDIAKVDGAIAMLEDNGSNPVAWARARATLTEVERETALAGLLTSLDKFAESVALAGPEIERLLEALGEVTGVEQSAHPERVAALAEGALIREWFAWYYANGGDRVGNTGEKIWGGLALDLGLEMQRKEPVLNELGRRLLVTVPLSLISVLLAYLIALPLGIFSVRKQGTLIDGVVTVVLFVLYSIPTFWAGLMLILAFGATGLDWLPVLGLHDKDAHELGGLAYAWDYLMHIILPVATLTYGSFAYLSRQMRAGMLDVIRQDYIRTARAKGMSERVVIYKHALRNSMIPVLTLLASILPILIGGSVIVEKIFSIPGMGMYAFEGLLRRDFNIVMATTIFVGIMTQFGILMSDITYSLVDPRIRHD